MESSTDTTAEWSDLADVVGGAGRVDDLFQNVAVSSSTLQAGQARMRLLRGCWGR